MAGDWGDAKRFTAETVRTIAFAIIGAIAAILILKPAEKSVEYAAELDRTKLSIKAKVVDEFLTASYKYTAVAYDACKGDRGALKIFQNEAVDAFRGARNRLVVYFDGGGALARQLEAVDEKTNELGKVCDGTSPKEEWEPVRRSLKALNNDLAVAALKSVGLFRAEMKQE